MWPFQVGVVFVCVEEVKQGCAWVVSEEVVQDEVRLLGSSMAQHAVDVALTCAAAERLLFEQQPPHRLRVHAAHQVAVVASAVVAQMHVGQVVSSYTTTGKHLHTTPHSTAQHSAEVGRRAVRHTRLAGPMQCVVLLPGAAYRMQCVDVVHEVCGLWRRLRSEQLLVECGPLGLLDDVDGEEGGAAAAKPLHHRTGDGLTVTTATSPQPGHAHQRTAQHRMERCG